MERLTFLVFLSSIILLTLGAAISFKKTKAALLICLAALLIIPASVIIQQISNPYVFFVVIIGILNLISLEILKSSEIKGVDYALVALMAIATLFVIYTNDLVLVLATFVLVSVPTYVLVMISDNKAKVDTGIKYITFMVIATVLFLIGAVLLIYTNSNPIGNLYIIGYIMLILGLGLEVGCAPLHEWVPDVFTSADPIPISIIASLAKIVPFIVAYKILITLNTLIYSIAIFIALIATLSMFIGNIGALTSKELSRVLGYSTVANMGYIMATLVVFVDVKYIYIALTGVLLQLFVNSFGKIGFFTAIKEGGASKPLMYTLALSFIGLPPLMGFWSKFFILSSLVGVGYIWLAVILVINAAISVPYYLRIARELSLPPKVSLANFIALIAVLITLITILPPNWFMEAMKTLI
ncbi:MAG: proton-conducting transporter membrane subunit [Methanosarcinales archaeon]